MTSFKGIAFAVLFFVAFLYAIEPECPRFVEFFPDPVDTTDDAGEYVEIRLADLPETLFVRLEDKPRISIPNTFGNRLLLHRDSLACPEQDSLDCRKLGGTAIPNSREMFWTLQQGSCTDTVYLPQPKAGKVLQLDEFNGTWVYAEPTPGVANSDYEMGIADCGIELVNSAFVSGFFDVAVKLSNCDSSIVYYESEKLDLAARHIKDSVKVNKSTIIKIESDGMPERFVAFVPPDDVLRNDTLRTLLVSRKAPPLSFTEVHYCPEEGYEEWVELYNSLPRELELGNFDFCGRGKLYADSVSLQAFESALVAKDTSALRLEIGFNETRILKASFGALKNTADTLALCYVHDTLDVVTFGKETSSVCPKGFNPRTGRKENTPGFQSRELARHGTAPFNVEFSSRSVSLYKHEPIRVRVGTNGNEALQVRWVLVSESGRLVKEDYVEANDDTWFVLPILSEQPGVYFFKCIAGRYEKKYGIVLRP